MKNSGPNREISRLVMEINSPDKEIRSLDRESNGSNMESSRSVREINSLDRENRITQS
jgi:hypothetical protein